MLLASLSPAPGAPSSLRGAGPASCFQAQNLADYPPLIEASKGSPPAAQWGQLWGLGEPRASTSPQAADSRKRHPAPRNLPRETLRGRLGAGDQGPQDFRPQTLSRGVCSVATGDAATLRGLMIGLLRGLFLPSTHSHSGSPAEML